MLRKVKKIGEKVLCPQSIVQLRCLWVVFRNAVVHIRCALQNLNWSEQYSHDCRIQTLWGPISLSVFLVVSLREKKITKRANVRTTNGQPAWFVCIRRPCLITIRYPGSLG